jgi:hypothetical protein
MCEVDEVTNALPQEYLSLRQWARMTASCARSHARQFQAADQTLGEIVRQCEALVLLCESVEKEHFRRG